MLQQSLFVAWVVGGGLWAGTTPIEAMPYFARKYDVTCATCHVMPPKLNLTGWQFAMNGYRWEGRAEQPTLPFAVWTTGRSEDRRSAGLGENYLQKVQIIAGGRLSRDTAYFVEWLPQNKVLIGPGRFQGGHRRFEDLFIVNSLSPTTTLTVGQFPLASQVDTSYRLSVSEPLALSAEVDGFAPSGCRPAVRLEVARLKAGGTNVDGDFYALALPLRGEITLNDQFTLSTHLEGVFLQGYRRRGLNTVGGFAFLDDDRKIYGVVGTYHRGRWFSTLIAAIADGATKNDTRLSWENEYLLSRAVMVGWRWDRQSKTAHPNAFVPYINIAFPLTRWTVRLQYERRQQPGDKQEVIDISVIF
ncbi:MAG: hypothetical protein NZT92_01760 [Abditibacteriales bacterium]|nr:hypothetical protein [Abditibacteriales bacterium]MDW8364438.1 hypothetical protein [Abditibacteriales bacterium]